MALPRITQKEMTEQYIDKLMVEREAEAKKARQLKKKQAYKPDPEASFSWSANTSTRGRR